MGNQIIIQIVLIVALLLLMVVLFQQRPGARPTAIRRLTYFFLLVVAIIAVIFPDLLTKVADLVGVGRGTDLLLYVLVLMFISHLMTSKSSMAKANQRTTKLARHIAIMEAEPAAEAGKRLSKLDAEN